MAWKLVYDLHDDLRANPEEVRLTQAVTLDDKRPHIGLSGECGLYGSETWWRNIETGRIAKEIRTGVVVRTFYAGMDSDRRHNSFYYDDQDGERQQESFYVDPGEGLNIFRPGVAVRLTYILQPMKRRDQTGRPVIEPFLFTLEAD